MLGQDGADEPDDRCAIREDPDAVGAAADFPVEAFGGVVRPDLVPDLDGEAGEGEDVGPGVVEVVGDGGELVAGVVEQPVELGVDGVGVGLVVDRVEHGLDHQAGAGLRTRSERT